MSTTDNFPWKKFFTRLYEVSLDADIFSRAAQVAFYFSFALFPLLYFLVSLFGLVLETSGELRAELFGYLRQILPFSVFDLVRRTVEEIVENSTGGKLTLGLAVTLWSASAGVDAIRTALNSIYGFVDDRSIWRSKLQSLVLTLGVSVLTAVMLAIVFYGWQMVQHATAAIGYEITSPLVLVIIQWISILLVMLFACELIYNLLPAFKKFHWAWVTPGTVLAIVLWLLLTGGFRLYLSYFNTYNKAYGSLGAVMIMMLWLYLTSLALMIGGVINSVLYKMRTESVDE
jgi:membrane protein